MAVADLGGVHRVHSPVTVVLEGQLQPLSTDVGHASVAIGDSRGRGI